jgi:hypothetical protein
MAQVSDADLHALVDPDANSIAILVQHLAGNLRSRFTDFLTTDGEKPTRNRDAEFEMPDRASRAEMMQAWDSSWSVALDTIDALKPEDLDRTVHIRGEAFLVVESLSRSVTHTATRESSCRRWLTAFPTLTIRRSEAVPIARLILRPRPEPDLVAGVGGF